MKRREFLTTAATAAAAPFVFSRSGRGQAANQQAKLARLAIMSLTFGSILKNANQPDSPTRTLDIMDLGQMYADKFGVHNVELQHAYLPSTDDGWLKDFRARLEKSRSRVSNINCEFGATTTISAESAVGRLQAIDLTKRWIDHAATLGCPRIMLNQGQLTEANKAVAIATLEDDGRVRQIEGRDGLQRAARWRRRRAPRCRRSRRSARSPARTSSAARRTSS